MPLGEGNLWTYFSLLTIVNSTRKRKALKFSEIFWFVLIKEKTTICVEIAWLYFPGALSELEWQYWTKEEEIQAKLNNSLC